MNNFPSIFVLDQNENSREIMKSFLEEIDKNIDIELFADYNFAIEQIKAKENPPFVFVDISNYNDEIGEIINKIQSMTKNIIVTGTNYSTDTIIKAMRWGAKEFLPKPVLKEDLKRCLALFNTQSNETTHNDSKIITIYSNKGGIGKTTIATNLAIELAKTTGDKVALIDLNLQLGDISTFLNINPPFDVAYAIKNLIDKKENSFLQVFEKYQNTNLFVLSDPNYIEQSESITPQQIENLFKVLREIFPYIIVDMSSNIDANSLKILDCSDLILFTTIVNIPAIRNAQRCLNLFNSRRYPKDKVKIIINRYMENDEITLNDIETTLGEKIYWKFPNNYFSIMEAINKGIPVYQVNTNSNIANSFRDFASKIADDIVEQTVLSLRKG